MRLAAVSCWGVDVVMAVTDDRDCVDIEAGAWDCD